MDYNKFSACTRINARNRIKKLSEIPPHMNIGQLRCHEKPTLRISTTDAHSPTCPTSPPADAPKDKFCGAKYRLFPIPPKKQNAVGWTLKMDDHIQNLINVGLNLKFY